MLALCQLEAILRPLTLDAVGTAGLRRSPPFGIYTYAG